jgi:hypothetical protein
MRSEIVRKQEKKYAVSAVVLRANIFILQEIGGLLRYDVDKHSIKLGELTFLCSCPLLNQETDVYTVISFVTSENYSIFFSTLKLNMT